MLTQNVQNNPPQDETSVFKKMKHVDHVRKRPDTYIGAGFGTSTEPIWTATLNSDGKSFFSKYAPCQIAVALISTSKELFDNATDNVERSRVENINPGIIQVSMSRTYVTIRNFGKHIPTGLNVEENMPNPQLIFGVLLTSDNYDDSVSRYKIGRNGYGVKLTNIFSKYFKLVIGDPIAHVLYTQLWEQGMTVCNPPTYEPYEGPGYTEITYAPDFPTLYDFPACDQSFLPSMESYYLCRTMEMSYAAQIVTQFQNTTLDFRDAMVYFKTHFNPFNPEMKTIHWRSDDGKQEFVIADNAGKGWAHAFVNGTPVHQGKHVNEYLKTIFTLVTDLFEKKFKKKITVTHLKKHVSILLRVTLDKPSFDSQIKKKLEKPTPKVNVGKNIQKEVLTWNFIEDLRNSFGVGDAKKKKDKVIDYGRVPEIEHALMAKSRDPNERLKCCLILTEGKTGKTLATKATKFLPGGKDYNGVLPLRGKPMNVSKFTRDRVLNNKEISHLLKALNADPDIDYHKNPRECLKLRYGKIALMMDADHDGFHICGLSINFILKLLASLAPFKFVVMIHTPVIEGVKGNSKLAFLYQKQHAKWMRENDANGWKFQYKKGLGSWNTDPVTLKRLFENPIIIEMVVDSTTNDMLTLAFDKNCSNQRKEWISAYDENSVIELTNPRPYTNFFMEDFRDYSKSAVIRAIPRLMDGMKPVHRKVLYSMFLKFPDKSKSYNFMKIPQFGGFVMERAGYHSGEGSLYDTIRGMGQIYLTGPNNLTLIRGEGNFGDRMERGQDASPARYLTCKLANIAYYIYPKEDFPLMEILFDDGEPIEPKEMFPIIPMALVNKCEGIGSGWSTKIYPHNPFAVIEWVRRWIIEKKSKRHLPRDELEIDVTTKPELVPWYRDYKGVFIRVKNKPYEVFRNEGLFHQEFHTTVIDEIPAEMSIQRYKDWGEKIEDSYLENPTEAIFRSFSYATQPPFINFRIDGLSIPTVEKLNLVGSVSMSNMVLINKDEKPVKFAYTYQIMCEWCMDRLDIYFRRKNHQMQIIERKLKFSTLKYWFVKDVNEGRLVISNRNRADILPYMREKGYPCGDTKAPKKKGPGKNHAGTDNAEEVDISHQDFLKIPVNSLTKDKADKLAEKVKILTAELEELKNTLPEDLWLYDLQQLESQISRLYATPLY